jgi:hypothetical protein
LLKRRSEARVADRLKEEKPPQLDVESDPRKLNEYLFRDAGELSLREYVADPDVRGVVERAIARVDDLLGESDGDLYAADALPPQVARAKAALDRGDIVGALAQLRLGVELELRSLAALSDVPEARAGLSVLVRRLNQVGAVDASEARGLSYAIRVANGALHGEPVAASQAGEALDVASRALESLRTRTRTRRGQ